METVFFKDESREAEYQKNGFIHIKDFIPKETVSEAFNLFNRVYNYNKEEKGMWNSLYDVSPEVSKQVSNELHSILSPVLKESFYNFFAPAATFMTKNPNRLGICDLHRDFSVLDESEYEYRNIWIPLVDTSVENGTLYALRGSHHFFDYPLPMFTKWSYIEHQDLLFRHCSIINAGAGDLVVYGDRLLHGSFINQTDKPRPVIHFGIIPPEAGCCYYHLESDNTVKVYEVPFSYYLENRFGNLDGQYPLKKKFQFAPPAISEADISNWLLSEK